MIIWPRRRNRGNVASILARAGLLSAGSGGRSEAVGPAGNSAEVQQFYERLLTLPDASRQTLYASLINGLVADGVWALLDALYIFAAADSATSLINLVQSSFAASLIGSPTFTADRGWLGTGIFTNINSNFNPSTAAGKFTQNDAMAGVWNRTAAAANVGPVINTAGMEAAISIYPRYTGDFRVYSINTDGNTNNIAAQVDSSGWLTIQRTAADASELGRNGSQLTTTNRVSATVINSNIHFVQGPWEGSAGAIGKSMTAGQQTAIYNRLSTWMTAVGAV